MSASKRTDESVLSLITETAQKEPNIIAVILSGSRTQPHLKQDDYMDFDVIYLVKHIDAFVNHKEWLTVFGKPLIMQEPELMDGNWPNKKNQYTYLMQFDDGHRIDLRLIDETHFDETMLDSLSVIILDKEARLKKRAKANLSDYLPTAPSETAFDNCCLEFFWLSLYVLKGLLRNQVIYAKHILDVLMRQELLKLLSWHVAFKTHYQVNIGAYWKHLAEHLDQPLLDNYMALYSDAKPDNIWQCLIGMCDLFMTTASQVANSHGFSFRQEDYQRVIDYLSQAQNDLDVLA